MLRIFKNYFRYWYFVVLIVALLFLQAYCDLALPQYTSNMIDVGIMNGGTSHILPEKIQADEYDYVKLFMTEEEAKAFSDSYKAEGDLYVRKSLSEEDLKALDEKLLPAILINYQMSAVQVDSFKEQIYDSEAAGAQLAAAGITREAFLAMSVEQIGSLLHMDIKSYEKEVDDENGNPVKEEYVDMRSIFSAMADAGMMNESSIQEARSMFEKISEEIGSNTLKSMGYKWATEREEQAGIDLHKKQTDYLWIAGGKMLLMALLMMACVIMISFFSSIVGGRIGRDLREQVFSRVLSFSGKEIDQFSTASLITRCTNDIQQVQFVSIMMLRMVFYAPIIGIGGVIKVVHTGAGMGWIIFVAVGVIMALVSSLMMIAMPKFKIMQTLVDGLNMVSRELLTGLSVIRAFGREKESEQRFDEANTRLMKTQLFTNRVMTFMMPAMTLTMTGVNILIVWTAAHKIDEGVLQVGAMTAFITYAMQIIMSFLMLTGMSIMLPRAGVAAERINEIARTESSINDPENARKLDSCKGVLSFEEVSFRYPNANEDVLEGISFTAEPGKTTAIIGSTGCGKSTLVNLIPRLYDVTGGRILLDGVDIRELTMKDLREYLGFVPQKAVLFSGTISSNLRFGKRDASDEELEAAAEVAQAMEFINNKEDRMNSHIAQGGSNVSGGQKQRLSIARAIAKDPSIYIFDDSFSALDMKTDATLRKALAEKSKDKTVIIVAQRISTILHADQILVLDDGKIVGKGNHRELMTSCEAYQEIARSQLSEADLEKTMAEGGDRS